MRFNLQSVVLFAFIFSLFACSSGDTEEFRTAVYVNELDIESIAIPLTDEQHRLHIRDNRQFDLSVLATLGDGSTQTVSRFLQWSSSAPDVISVNGEGVVTALTEGTSTITVRLGEFSAVVDMTSSDARLVSIEIVSNFSAVRVCTSEATLSVTGTYDDASTGTVSPDKVSWDSTAQNVAIVQTFDQVLTILALSGGSTNLTASVELTDPDELIESDPLAVNIDASALSSIAITPNPASVAQGESISFVATGTYTDTATRNITRASDWSSNSPSNLAPVTTTRGRFNALLQGSATVTAACAGPTASANVTITEPRRATGIEIRDSDEEVIESLLTKQPNSANFQLHVWLIYNNGDRERIFDDNDELNWEITSGSSSVLSVDSTDGNKGFVELLGNNIGSVTLKATYRYSNTQLFEKTITIDVRVDTD